MEVEKLWLEMLQAFEQKALEVEICDCGKSFKHKCECMVPVALKNWIPFPSASLINYNIGEARSFRVSTVQDYQNKLKEAEQKAYDRRVQELENWRNNGRSD